MIILPASDVVGVKTEWERAIVTLFCRQVYTTYRDFLSLGEWGLVYLKGLPGTSFLDHN